MDTLRQDVRQGIRLLARKPGFAFFAVIALGLGIGATTAVFTLVDALVMNPVPFKDIDRLAEVWETLQPAGAERYLVSPGTFRDLKDRAGPIEQVEAYRNWSVNLAGAGGPVRVSGHLVSPGLFQMLGVELSLGRGFSDHHARPGHDQVVVLSHAFWQESLGSDPDVIGRSLTLDGRAMTVLGVVSAGHDYPLGADLWAPLAMDPEESGRRGSHRLHVIGRLGDEVTLASARADLDAFSARLRQEHPGTDAGRGMRLDPLREQINLGTRQFVQFLMGAAGFVLLLACANVAGLQLARGAERRTEIATRLGLGATRLRVVRQLMTESALLAAPGGVLGMLLAVWGVDLMKSEVPAWVSRHVVAGLDNVEVDGRALVFCAAAALLSGVLAGMAPAFLISSLGVDHVLKEAGRSSTVSPTRQRVRQALVVAEVALALVLLVGAGLMVKGFRHLLSVDRGLDTDGLLTLKISLPETTYPEPHHLAGFWERLMERLEALPEIRAVTLVDNLPVVSFSRRVDEVGVEGRAAAPPEEIVRAEIQPTFRTSCPDVLGFSSR